MGISDGTSEVPTLREARGIFSKEITPGCAILGFRLKDGELWAGQWSPGEGVEVLALTVYKPSKQKVLTIKEWNSWQVASDVFSY